MIDFAKATRLPSTSLPVHTVAAKQSDYNHRGLGGPPVSQNIREKMFAERGECFKALVVPTMARGGKSHLPSKASTTNLHHLDWKNSRCSSSLARLTSALQHGPTLVWALLAPGPPGVVSMAGPDPRTGKPRDEIASLVILPLDVVDP